MVDGWVVSVSAYGRHIVQRHRAALTAAHHCDGSQGPRGALEGAQGVLPLRGVTWGTALDEPMFQPAANLVDLEVVEAGRGQELLGVAQLLIGNVKIGVRNNARRPDGNTKGLSLVCDSH